MAIGDVASTPNTFLFVLVKSNSKIVSTRHTHTHTRGLIDSKLYAHQTLIYNWSIESKEVWNAHGQRFYIEFINRVVSRMYVCRVFVFVSECFIFHYPFISNPIVLSLNRFYPHLFIYLTIHLYWFNIFSINAWISSYINNAFKRKSESNRTPNNTEQRNFNSRSRNCLEVTDILIFWLFEVSKLVSTKNSHHKNVPHSNISCIVSFSWKIALFIIDK